MPHIYFFCFELIIKRFSHFTFYNLGSSANLTGGREDDAENRWSLFHCVAVVATAVCFVALAEVPVFASSSESSALSPALFPETASTYQTPERENIYNDEFDTERLNPRWRWLNENDERWRLNRVTGTLVISTATGDMAVDCNNAENVLLQAAPSGSFEITTKLNILANQDFQQAGIVIVNGSAEEPDLDNYVKMMVLHSSFDGGLVTEFVTEEDGAFPVDGWAILEIEESIPAYLRLVGINDTITGYFSNDGETWKEVGSHTFALSPGAQMGLYAVSGVMAFGDQPTCTPESAGTNVAFDYFRVESTARAESRMETSFTVSNSENARIGRINNERADTLDDGSQIDDDPSTFQDEQESDVEAPFPEIDYYISQRLDSISYASNCTFIDRVVLDQIRIGAKTYKGAYDIWNDCDDGTIQGVLLVTPDNDALLYLLLVAELPTIYDISAFEAGLAEQLGQTVAFANNRSVVDDSTDSVGGLTDAIAQGRSGQTGSNQTSSNQTRSNQASSQNRSDLRIDNVNSVRDNVPSSDFDESEEETVSEGATSSSTPEANITQPIIIVRVQKLNLRSGPGTNYAVVGTVSQDIVLNVQGQVNNCSWLQIATDTDESVWVSGGEAFVEMIGECAKIPVVDG